MTLREEVMAVLTYRECGRLPVVQFGYWGETLAKWAQEGHLTQEETKWWDGSSMDAVLNRKLGFDVGWYSVAGINAGLMPAFEPKVLETQADGTELVRNWSGAIEMRRPGAGSIPAEVGHTLKDRASWEEEFLPRLQEDPNRGTPVDPQWLASVDVPCSLHCGSLLGMIRNWIGMENLAYVYVDDEPLFREMIDTVGGLCYRYVKERLSAGAKFDMGHFWEDICFKNGPLVSPSVFAEYVGPHYKRITQLLNAHGVEVVSVDCDGMIDALLPVWFENGVNTMFPIEVGTWDASIAPWREKYGKELRGVGGMNKTVFAHDKKAVDREIERLKPLVDLGGYLPCPDHRIAPDAEWDNVRYYCDRMHHAFG